MEPVPKSTILLAYRHLYQHLLRAVKYSKPARYIARDRIRAAFRNSSPQQHFQPAEISRTLEFLDNAAKYRGLEHRIVKNCMHVWWSRSPSSGDGMSPVYVHVTLLQCVSATGLFIIHYASFIIHHSPFKTVSNLSTNTAYHHSYPRFFLTGKKKIFFCADPHIRILTKRFAS